jgi:hypothetical protein
VSKRSRQAGGKLQTTKEQTNGKSEVREVVAREAMYHRSSLSTERKARLCSLL